MQNATAKPDHTETRAIHERWGDLSAVGFTAVPNTLIQAQYKLGLSSNDVVILLNFVMHWWSPDSMPYPRSDTIAARTGLGRRTIQRTMKSLEARGMIKRVMIGNRTYVDLTGLKEQLAFVAPGYAWRREKLKRNSGGEAGVQARQPSEM